MIEEDQDDVLNFSARHIKEIYIQENKKGYVDTIYRRFKMPSQAAADKFGIENISKDLINTARKDPFQDVQLVHVIKPRLDFDPKKEDKKNMPFSSIYFEYESGHIISTGGFKSERRKIIPVSTGAGWSVRKTFSPV